jgi:hypothetical protein
VTARWVGLVGASILLVACSAEDSTDVEELDCSGDATSGFTGVSTWPADLSAFCRPDPPDVFQTNQCGSYRIVRRQVGVDTENFDYYSAANGEFVATVHVQLSGGHKSCSGPSVFAIPDCDSAWIPVTCEQITPG